MVVENDGVPEKIEQRNKAKKQKNNKLNRHNNGTKWNNISNQNGDRFVFICLLPDECEDCLSVMSCSCIGYKRMVFHLYESSYEW